MLIHHFRVNITYPKIALGSYTDAMKVEEMRNDKIFKLMSVNFSQCFEKMWNVFSSDRSLLKIENNSYYRTNPSTARCASAGLQS